MTRLLRGQGALTLLQILALQRHVLEKDLLPPDPVIECRLLCQLNRWSQDHVECCDVRRGPGYLASQTAIVKPARRANAEATSPDLLAGEFYDDDRRD